MGTYKFSPSSAKFLQYLDIPPRIPPEIQAMILHSLFFQKLHRRLKNPSKGNRILYKNSSENLQRFFSKVSPISQEIRQTIFPEFAIRLIVSVFEAYQRMTTDFFLIIIILK